MACCQPKTISNYLRIFNKQSSGAAGSYGPALRRTTTLQVNTLTHAHHRRYISSAVIPCIQDMYRCSLRTSCQYMISGNTMPRRSAARQQRCIRRKRHGKREVESCCVLSCGAGQCLLYRRRLCIILGVGIGVMVGPCRYFQLIQNYTLIMGILALCFAMFAILFLKMPQDRWFNDSLGALVRPGTST
ncbi:hypothetical protein D3OALGA1CA_4673 [Olavius algarvensis associated proteobacterium Delta 3]|nr:hypothetical protein D3OALGB2SA_4863 [Olavius algarvensis associated proteobacterium Delta 3]CAB5155117.1 hypothetical protein D3OALGA1CA_4673 [Olavius algarvensis associated proteobacterium Delta 3]